MAFTTEGHIANVTVRGGMALLIGIMAGWVVTCATWLVVVSMRVAILGCLEEVYVLMHMCPRCSGSAIEVKAYVLVNSYHAMSDGETGCVITEEVEGQEHFCLTCMERLPESCYVDDKRFCEEHDRDFSLCRLGYGKEGGVE